MPVSKTFMTLALGALVASPALAQEPYTKPDDSWISISGTVASPTADNFVLDYGDGTILVEMDDWDSYGDAYGLMDGDEVTVYGRIDDDLFEVAKIEAGSVYVEDLNTYFYASSADDEGGYDGGHVYWTVSTPIVVGHTNIRGTVTEVDDSEFTLDTGAGSFEVEIEQLTYNPLDDNGFQQIEKGDRVSVWGYFDHDFLEGRVFDAESVITLDDASADKG